MEAMLDLSFELGYEAVSVDLVVAAAGADRADFDRAFASKQDCAMALLDDITSDNLRAAKEAYEGEERWPDSLRAAAYAEARWISANPKKVRFGIVEMLWAGELTQAVREAAFREYIQMVDGGRAVAANPDSVPASTAEGVIGSITQMLVKKLQQGRRPPNPYDFVPELMYLAVRPYLGEELARRELAIPAPQPTAENEVRVDRERFLEAMLDLVCDQGYEATSVEQVLERTGAGREEFDRAFASKEDCALAILVEIGTTTVRNAQAAYESEPDWPSSLRAAAYAHARWMTENPKKVRFGMLEMLWGNEMTRAVRERFFAQFVGMVDGGREVAADPDAIPPFTAEAAIGSITETLTKRLQKGGDVDPFAFIPELMYMAVLPYLGEEAAERELRIPAPQHSGGD